MCLRSFPSQRRRDSSKFYGMFWVTDSERVTDDHPTQQDSMTMEKWKEKKDLMEYLNDRTWPNHGMSAYAMKIRTSVLNRFRSDHISDKNGLRGDTSPHVRRPFAAVPKATFSFAMAVMDKVEGWNEKKWVGSYLVACMWIYTKAVLCDGRMRHPPLDLQPFLGLFVERASWVTEDFLWEHEWIMETNVTSKENVILEALNYDVDVPCPLQWGLLWFSAPRNLNRKFVNWSSKIHRHNQQCNRLDV